MTLYAKMKKDPGVRDILAYFSNISRASSADASTAIFALCMSCSDEGAVKARIEAARNMCNYMKPAVDDVIAILLQSVYSRGRASLRAFEEWFKKERAERYYSWLTEAFSQAPKNDSMLRYEQVDHYIMMRVCNRMFDSLLRSLSKKGVADTADIIEAFELAKTAHYWDCEESGLPHLAHPISVATILAEAGVDSSIIAAALLHEVAERTAYSTEDVTNVCGARISKYVEAVELIQEQYKATHVGNSYSDDKTELDSKSFEKLIEEISAEPRMIFALYIKAADRIHALQTVDRTPEGQNPPWTDETEPDYLPLLRRLKLNHFVGIIEDLAWRRDNRQYYESIRKTYDDILVRNAAFIEEMKQILTLRLGSEFNRFCSMRGFPASDYEVTITERRYLVREVYGFAKASLGAERSVTPESVNKKTVPVCDFDIIVESAGNVSTIDTFITMFVKMFTERIAPTGRTIIDMELDRNFRFVVTVEDRHRTVFRLCFSTRDNYITHRIGNVMGASIVEETGVPVAAPPKDCIYIKLRNGKVVAMPAGATVLDVAFLIHHEVGLAALSATVNGAPATLYTQLHDEDHVIIKADTCRENGVTKHFTSHAMIAWLNHVVTEKARKTIIKKLAKKYEEEDPASDTPASDATTTNVVNMLADKLGSSAPFKLLD